MFKNTFISNENQNKQFLHQVI